MLEISMSSIFASLIFSTLGFYVFKQGKLRANIQMVIIGIILMAYTYFTKKPWQDWGIGTALTVWAYMIKDQT